MKIFETAKTGRDTVVRLVGWVHGNNIDENSIPNKITL
jgi:hypothetical protein